MIKKLFYSLLFFNVFTNCCDSQIESESFISKGIELRHGLKIILKDLQKMLSMNLKLKAKYEFSVIHVRFLAKPLINEIGDLREKFLILKQDIELKDLQDELLEKSLKDYSQLSKLCCHSICLGRVMKSEYNTCK